MDCILKVPTPSNQFFFLKKYNLNSKHLQILVALRLQSFLHFFVENNYSWWEICLVVQFILIKGNLVLFLSFFQN